jgi:hypothetical protein
MSAHKKFKYACPACIEVGIQYSGEERVFSDPDMQRYDFEELETHLKSIHNREELAEVVLRASVFLYPPAFGRRSVVSGIKKYKQTKYAC